jgi:phosphate uptake regulator
MPSRTNSRTLDLTRMVERATSMLRPSLAAFIERDVSAAEQIANEDDDVDALYHQV